MTAPDQQPHPQKILIDLIGVIFPANNEEGCTLTEEQCYQLTEKGHIGHHQECDDCPLPMWMRTQARYLVSHNPAAIAAAARAEERALRELRDVTSWIFKEYGGAEGERQKVVISIHDHIIDRIREIKGELRSQQPGGEDGGAVMGAGIRPKGKFPYAALRYNAPEARAMLPCFGKNANKVPDAGLCETCAHRDDCKKEFYAGVK